MKPYYAIFYLQRPAMKVDPKLLEEIFLKYNIMENKEQETVEQAAVKFGERNWKRQVLDGVSVRGVNQEAFKTGANWQKAQGLFTREDMEKAFGGGMNYMEGIPHPNFDEFMSSNYPETK